MLTLFQKGRYASVRDFGRALGQAVSTAIVLATAIMCMAAFGGIS